MVAGANAEGNLKELLSACRQLDKLRLHPRIVETGDWQVVKWLAKRPVWGESAVVSWARIELFVWLAEQVVDPAKAEVVVLACISVACLLQVGEAATVRTRARGDVRFNGKKGRPGIWDVEVGPWTKWWVLFLSDDSSMGVPTCPSPSKTRRSYMHDGKRLLGGRISRGTGGMPCEGVARPSCGSGALASR